MEVWDLVVGKVGLFMEEDEDGQELGRDFFCVYFFSGKCQRTFRNLSCGILGLVWSLVRWVGLFFEYRRG